MGEFSPWHLLIVVAAFMLLFGANKLPQMARSVGQSMRIFKAETRALSSEKEHEQLPFDGQLAATDHSVFPGPISPGSVDAATARETACRLVPSGANAYPDFAVTAEGRQPPCGKSKM